MTNISEYIESGILEMYVLGLTTQQQTDEINELVKTYPEINTEIDFITNALLVYSSNLSLGPNVTLKAMVLATIDYTERLKNGEKQTFPPLLSELSTIKDYDKWLRREDMLTPDTNNEIFAKIIGYTLQCNSAIVWIPDATPPEIHTKEFEKFLILEGTCDIYIGDIKHSLIQGNFLQIPLHVVHYVKVTSVAPCKVILQRVAA